MHIGMSKRQEKPVDHQTAERELKDAELETVNGALGCNHNWLPGPNYPGPNCGYPCGYPYPYGYGYHYSDDYSYHYSHHSGYGW